MVIVRCGAAVVGLTDSACCSSVCVNPVCILLIDLSLILLLCDGNVDDENESVCDVRRQGLR